MGRAGFEPATFRLSVERSSRAELPAPLQRTKLKVMLVNKNYRKYSAKNACFGKTNFLVGKLINFCFFNIASSLTSVSIVYLFTTFILRITLLNCIYRTFLDYDFLKSAKSRQNKTLAVAYTKKTTKIFMTVILEQNSKNIGPRFHFHDRLSTLPCR